jgi:hypothetical protein
VSSDLTITCSRIVFIDSEFDAKKGQGERLARLIVFARSRLVRTAVRSSTVLQHPILSSRPGIAATPISRLSLEPQRKRGACCTSAGSSQYR